MFLVPLKRMNSVKLHCFSFVSLVYGELYFLMIIRYDFPALIYYNFNDDFKLKFDTT